MNKRQKEMQWLYLENEERAIKELEKVYKQAQKDIESNIEHLLARSDADTPTVIYQVDYQKALRKQVSGALDVLEANQFATVSDYLVKCYETGFIGAQYDLHGQGVPVIFPIDQKKMINAVRLDSAISEGLYTRMGENVKELKKQITGNISRGIATGLGYAQIAQSLAQGMNSPYNKAINRTKVIARTEGHRIQIQSQLDACQKAKEAGADTLKQWDSTLDGRTRPEHRVLDGKIRELDEDFEYSGGTVKAPGFFGTPAQDCNCRCALNQRARWALDEGELLVLRERAEFFGLDKTKDFEEYKNKYLKATDNADILNMRLKNLKGRVGNEGLAVLESYSALPEKARLAFKDIVFEFGYDRCACDIKNRVVQVGVNATKEQIDHELGHLVERELIDAVAVKKYKESLVRGLEAKDISKEIYYDNVGNPIKVHILKGSNFVSEYQGLLYVNDPKEATKKDGTIDVKYMGEAISEPFRIYCKNKADIEDKELLKLIEEAMT